MRNAEIHVIGAGLAGLAAAVRLAERGARVVIHEAAPQAGGRCRSYYDHAVGMVIDNGNHLLLSGNYAALSFLQRIEPEHALSGPNAAEFPFIDLKTGARWCLRPSAGRVPWWIFQADRRAPDTSVRDYFGILPLLWARAGTPISAAMACAGNAYERLWRPILLAALNTEPPEADAGLAAAVIRETLLVGGHACRPLIARDGLSPTLVEPAIRHLQARGATIRFEHNLHALRFDARRVSALDFGQDVVALAPNDAVVLAVPPFMAKTLVPEINVPDAFRAIVNGHFAIAPPPGFPPMMGVVNGTVEWVFAFPGRLSVTVSGADRLLGVPREELAATMWREVAAVAGIAEALPPWQIVRERRATFAALPEQNAKRPGAQTRWENLVLAGDWIATGLPATIEGAIRSGNRAADLLNHIGQP
ncbi:MAG: hydroxysqualene dehydroxylase HpnE [Xanthobacteraceae bacterium]